MNTTHGLSVFCPGTHELFRFLATVDEDATCRGIQTSLFQTQLSVPLGSPQREDHWVILLYNFGSQVSIYLRKSAEPNFPVLQKKKKAPKQGLASLTHDHAVLSPLSLCPLLHTCRLGAAPEHRCGGCGDTRGIGHAP